MRTLNVRRRAWFAATVLPVVVMMPIGAGVANAARDTSPGRSGFVTPTSPASLRDQVTVLTGSADWLVFRSTPALVTGLSPFGPTIERSKQNLVARSRKGHRVRLGSMPRHEYGWSTFGNWLVAGHVVEKSLTRVDQWNLRTGHRSTLQLPSRKDGLVAAAPDGVLYSTAQGTLGRAHRGSSKVTTYGQPFGSGGGFGGVSGPTGVVLETFEAAKFVPYAHLGQPQALDTDGGPSHAGDNLVCTSADASYAGCYTFDDGTDSVPAVSDLLVPLDGSAATVSSDCPGPDAVAGNHLVWTSDGRSSCSEDRPTLMSMQPGDSAPTTSDTGIEPSDIVSAYGSAVAPTLHSQSVLAIASATSSDVLFRTRRSPVTAGAFSLSAGRLFDVDDQSVPTYRRALSAVYRQTVVATRHSVRSTHRRTVGRGPGGVQVDPVSVSASAGGVAYGLTGHSVTSEQLRVVSPLGADATISGAGLDTPIIMSGGRVLYQRSGGAGWHLYDVVTHSDRAATALGRPDEIAGIAPSVALTGDDLYLTHGHELYLENLGTGHQTALAHTGGVPPVLALGDHVVWGYRKLSFLNVRKAGAVHTIAGRGIMVGITSAGVLQSRNNGVIELRRWGGKTDRLLGRSAYFSKSHRAIYPQLDGHVMAWVDARGRVRAAATRYSLARPRYLGDVATTNAVDDGQWRASLPYSEPLTSCHVTITSNGHVVRQAACEKSLMRAGVARVKWNGKDSHGAAAASGDYRWVVHARGSAGAALDASGSSQPVRGTVQVP